MRLRYCIGLAALAAGFVTAPALSTTHEVVINLVQFEPAELTITTGDTVIWRNNSFLQHSVTSGSSCAQNGLFNSGILDPTFSFQHTFDTMGSFPYFCMPHCLAGMRGTVTVDSPVSVVSTTWGAIKALYAVRR